MQDTSITSTHFICDTHRIRSSLNVIFVFQLHFISLQQDEKYKNEENLGENLITNEIVVCIKNSDRKRRVYSLVTCSEFCYEHINNGKCILLLSIMLINIYS